MRSLPLPVRVAAGLAATAVERGRQLPSYLIGLPITVASQTLQMSMRIQQQVTELAIKGDEVLGTGRNAEEQPEWATFDEDLSEEGSDEGSTEGTGGQVPADEEATAPQGNARIPDDYDELTLAQLRGRLRRFSAAELVEMLDYERAHKRRAEFTRMLSNRLDKLRAAETTNP